MTTKHAARTLVEILIVIAIIAILVLLVLASVQKVRTRAYRLQGENKLRQVALATHGYQELHGRLPPLIGMGELPKSISSQEIPVATFLLPFLEQPSFSDLYEYNSVDSPTLYHSHVVPTYVSSSDTTHTNGKLIFSEDVQPGVGNIAFNVQVFGPHFTACGIVDGKAHLQRTFPDGTSHTLLLATKRGKCGSDLIAGASGSFWISTGFKGHCNAHSTSAAMFGHVLPDITGQGPTFQIAPGEANCDPNLPQGFYTGGMSVSMADGSVQWIRGSIDPNIWRNGLLPGDRGGIVIE